MSLNSDHGARVNLSLAFECSIFVEDSKFFYNKGNEFILKKLHQISIFICQNMIFESFRHECWIRFIFCPFLCFLLPNSLKNSKIHPKDSSNHLSFVIHFWCWIVIQNWPQRSSKISEFLFSAPFLSYFPLSLQILLK